MKYLKTITDEDIFENPEFEKPSVFEKRTTVKAVVVNNEGKFGFVTNPVHGFYLLAGGGAESEDLEQEIKRECDEEINFEVEVIREIGRVREYRNRNAKEYETVCFLVKTIKESNEDTRTEDEKENNLQVVWLDKDGVTEILKRQVEKVKNGEVEFYNTAFNIVRDSFFFSLQNQEVEKAEPIQTEKIIEQPKVEQTQVESVPVAPKAQQAPKPQIQEKPIQQPQIKTIEKIVYKTDPNIITKLLNKARAKIQERKRKKLERIMTLFETKSQIKNEEIQKMLRVSRATAKRYMNILEKENKVIQVGDVGKGVLYIKKP